MPDLPSAPTPRPDAAAISLRVVNHISAKISYWDTDLRCVFANEAYREWFGKSPAQISGQTMREVIGALYEQNLPHIEGALAGRKQVFERRIPLPNGTVRDGIVTYTPDIVEGMVRGFSVHVADVTALRERERILARNIREVIQILEKTKDSFRSKELGLLRQKLEQVLNSPTSP